MALKASAQEGADVGQEFVSSEGFAKEIVDSQFQAEDDVDLIKKEDLFLREIRVMIKKDN